MTDETTTITETSDRPKREHRVAPPPSDRLVLACCPACGHVGPVREAALSRSPRCSACGSTAAPEVGRLAGKV